MPKINLGHVVGDVNPDTMIPFDDHSGEVLPPEEDPSYDWTAEPETGEEGEEPPIYAPGARESVRKILSGIKIKDFMSNAKAALMGLVTLGEMRQQLVNNGLCNIPGKYFLDAAFGKTLQDQVTKLNDENLKWSIINNESLTEEFLVSWNSVAATNGRLGIQANYRNAQRQVISGLVFGYDVRRKAFFCNQCIDGTWGKEQKITTIDLPG